MCFRGQKNPKQTRKHFLQHFLNTFYSMIQDDDFKPHRPPAYKWKIKAICPRTV